MATLVILRGLPASGKSTWASTIRSAPGIGSIWSMVWMLTSLRIMDVGSPFLLPGCPCKGSSCRAVGHTMR